MPPAKSTAWQTPHEVFNNLALRFGPFDLDPCGDRNSYASQHCGTYYAIGGLGLEWNGRVFVNPPYGRGLGDWIAKCSYEVAYGKAEVVVALLPARTDTRWFQHYILPCRVAHDGMVLGPHVREILFLKGRLRFVGASASAPFPSVVVVWRRPS
jgi:site-specific DNA-methyltransferase (adenine-specific)